MAFVKKGFVGLELCDAQDIKAQKLGVDNIQAWINYT